jgi:hypothetical protein
MTIYFLKFIHILIALSLLGLSVYCIVLTSSRKYAVANVYQHKKILRIHGLMLLVVMCAILTGTFLVYPTSFTFQTPWIRAAYLLCLIFTAGILLMTFLKRKLVTPKRYVWLIPYFMLTVILMGLVHDAVTKTTFIF